MVGPVFDLKDGWPEAPVRCCRHLEALTRAASDRGETAQQVLDRLLPLTRDAFVISREIGSGVVPLDAAERRGARCTARCCRALRPSGARQPDILRTGGTVK